MPEQAVMIELRKSKVLERQVPHAIERRVDIHRARAYAFQQLSKLVLIHST